MNIHQVTYALVQRITISETVLLLMLDNREEAIRFNHKLEGFSIHWNFLAETQVQFIIESPSLGKISFYVNSLDADLLNKINRISTAYFEKDDYELIELRSIRTAIAA